MPSPFDRVSYVLTLACGHLWSWNTERQGEFPQEVDCIHCDRDERIRSGAEPPGPFDTPETISMMDAVRGLRIKDIAEDES